MTLSQAKALATRTINKSKEMKGVESLGFKRSYALTSKMNLNYSKAAFISGVFSIPVINQQLSDMLGDMTEKEYRNWIISNAS